MSARKSYGFVLPELMVVIMIATLLAILAADSMALRIRDAAAQASATWMLSVGRAAKAYAGRYAMQLIMAEDENDLQSFGYSKWSQPGLTELKADGFLSSGFPETDRLTGGAGIQVIRDGVCPGHACRLEVLVYSRQPLRHGSSSAHDPRLVASWLLATEGRGGAVKPSDPQFISGAAFRLANPLFQDFEMLPVGTVALAVGPDSLGLSDWLRQYDDRDPHFTGPASIAGPVSVGSSLDVAGYVSVGVQNFAYTACPAEGAISREYSGGLLVCRNGRWRSAAGVGGGGYSVSSLKGCTQASRNPVTGDCSCPIEYYPVLIADNGANSAEVGRLRGYLCVGD